MFNFLYFGQVRTKEECKALCAKVPKSDARRVCIARCMKGKSYNATVPAIVPADARAKLPDRVFTPPMPLSVPTHTLVSVPAPSPALSPAPPPKPVVKAVSREPKELPPPMVVARPPAEVGPEAPKPPEAPPPEVPPGVPKVPGVQEIVKPGIGRWVLIGGAALLLIGSAYLLLRHRK